MLNQDFSTVCRVTGEVHKNAQVFQSEGNGVFVSPKRVLTSWHVVSGKQAGSVRFTNDMGLVSKMKPAKEGGRHFFDAGLDIALVELSQPIGHNIALPPKGASSLGYAFEGATGILLTRYQGTRSAYQVTYEPLRLSADPNMMTFSSEVKAVPGFSGSPIFAEDGMTLLSVLSQKDLVAERTAEAWNDVFASARLQKDIKPSLPFMGTRADRLAKWYRTVEAELNL